MRAEVEAIAGTRARNLRIAVNALTLAAALGAVSIKSGGSEEIPGRDELIPAISCHEAVPGSVERLSVRSLRGEERVLDITSEEQRKDKTEYSKTRIVFAPGVSGSAVYAKREASANGKETKISFASVTLPKDQIPEIFRDGAGTCSEGEVRNEIFIPENAVYRVARPGKNAAKTYARLMERLAQREMRLE